MVGTKQRSKDSPSDGAVPPPDMKTERCYYLEFTRMQPAQPIACVVVNPQCAAMFGVPAALMQDFVPPHVCIGTGNRRGVLHTNYDPARYPAEDLGITAVHWDEPCRVPLYKGMGGAITFGVYAAGAGAANETPNPAGDMRQPPRLCAYDWVEMQDLFDAVFHNNGELCLEMQHSALPPEVAPTVRVQYRVRANFTEKDAIEMRNRKFYCTEFRRSLEQLSQDGADSVFARYYSRVQTKVGEHARGWITRTTALQASLKQANGNLKLSDREQRDLVKLYMMDMCAPHIAKRAGVMFTPLLAEWTCQLATPMTETDMGIDAMHDLAQSVIRSAVHPSELDRACDFLMHEIAAQYCAKPANNEPHLSACRALLAAAPGGGVSQPAVQEAAERSFMLVCQVLDCYTTATAADPQRANYFFDQAPVAETVLQDAPCLQQAAAGGPQRDVVTLTTEAMLPAGNVMARIRELRSGAGESGAAPVAFADIGDDCESESVFARSRLAHLCVCAKRFGLLADTLRAEKGASKRELAAGVQALRTAAQALVSQAAFWKQQALDGLSSSERGTLAKLLLVGSYLVQYGSYNAELGLVASGCEQADSARVHTHDTARAQHTDSAAVHSGTTAGAAPQTREQWRAVGEAVRHRTRLGAPGKFRLRSRDPLRGSKTISGGVGGHCTIFATKTLWPLSVCAALSDGKPARFSRVCVLETTNSVVNMPSGNVATVRVRLGAGKLGDKFTCDSCETQVTAAASTTYRDVLERLCFTDSCRPQLLTEWYPQSAQADAPPNDFNGMFYRDQIFQGSKLAIYSDGVPGLCISNLCYDANRKRAAGKPAGVPRRALFSDIAAPATPGATPSVQPMHVDLADDADVQRIRAHIGVVRKTLDPPGCSAQVFHNRLRHCQPLDSLQARFAEPHGFENFAASCVYYPAHEITHGDLVQRLRAFNARVDGIQASEPIRFGSKDDDTRASWFVSLHMRIDAAAPATAATNPTTDTTRPAAAQLAPARGPRAG